MCVTLIYSIYDYTKQLQKLIFQNSKFQGLLSIHSVNLEWEVTLKFKNRENQARDRCVNGDVGNANINFTQILKEEKQQCEQVGGLGGWKLKARISLTPQISSSIQLNKVACKNIIAPCCCQSRIIFFYWFRKDWQENKMSKLIWVLFRLKQHVKFSCCLPCISSSVVQLLNYIYYCLAINR